MQRTNPKLVLAFVLPLLVLFAWTVHAVIIPVALGALFAVILFPLVPRVRARLGPLRNAAPALVLLLSVLVVLLPMAFVVVMSVRTVRRAAGQNLDDLRRSVEQALSAQLDHLDNLAQNMGIQLDTQALRGQVIDGAQALVYAAGERLGGAAAGSADLVVATFLLLFSIYAFLGEGSAILRWLGNLLPFSPARTQQLFHSVHQAVRGVILGSILTGLLQSTLCLVALLVFGVPGAFVWSVLAFLLSFLPMIGTTPITLAATAYLGLASHWGYAAGMVGAMVIIGTADNLVRPLVQGVESNMHPLLTLMAIFGGLHVMGAAGIFLGPVVASMALWSINNYATWSGTDVLVGPSPMGFNASSAGPALHD